MQQLLPAEHASSEAAPKQPTSDPHGTPKASTGGVQGGKQQAQRASSTAKASTPKRQDEVTTKPAGAKSNDKEEDRQDRDRSHSARRDRAQPVTVLCRTCSWKALQILYCLKFLRIGQNDDEVSNCREEFAGFVLVPLLVFRCFTSMRNLGTIC